MTKSRTKTRLKKTVSRQTSIIVLGICVLGFALAYFSREPFPFTAFANKYDNQPTAVSTPQAVTNTTHKSQPKLSVSANQPVQTQVPQAQQPAAANPSAAITGVGSLNDLLAMHESLSCSVTARNGSGRTGNAYLSGRSFRVDLTSGVSLLNDGTHYYAWVRGAGNGLVLPLVSVSGSTLALHGALDPSQSLAFGCNP